MITLPTSAWSVHQAQTQGQRELLANFWLHAPTDMLEILWSSPVGKATVALVQELTDDSELTPAEITLRTEINQKLSQGLQQPLATQLLSANFLFAPKDRLKIQNPDQSLPSWFVNIYRGLYENSDAGSIPTYQSTPEVPINNEPDDLTKFPENLQELVSNKIQLNRMLGLSNLYYIDPEDNEILEELLAVRRSFALAIDNCNEELLEDIWVNHLQDRYWSMVRCGIQTHPLSNADEELKQSAVEKLSPAMGGGFNKNGSTNALLIAMLYFEPGTMTVNDPQQNVPVWLRDNFNEVFLNAKDDSK